MFDVTNLFLKWISFLYSGTYNYKSFLHLYLSYIIQLILQCFVVVLVQRTHPATMLLMLLIMITTSILIINISVTHYLKLDVSPPRQYITLTMLLSYQIVLPCIVLLLIYRSYLQLLYICVVCLHYCNVVLYLDVSIFCVMTKYCSIDNNIFVCLAILFLQSPPVLVYHIILACNNLILFYNIIMSVSTKYNTVMFLLLYYIVVLSRILMFCCFVMLVCTVILNYYFVTL